MAANTKQYTIGAANSNLDFETDLGIKGGVGASIWITNLHATQAVVIRPGTTALGAVTDAGGYTIPPGKSRQFPCVPTAQAFAAGAATIIEAALDYGGTIGPPQA